MNALSAIGLALLLIGTTPRLAFANAYPAGTEAIIFPAWLLVLLTLFASLAGGRYTMKRRHRCKSPFTDRSSARGSIGYSSIYGSWGGE